MRDRGLISAALLSAQRWEARHPYWVAESSQMEP
jgi:hypothetical protein